MRFPGFRLEGPNKKEDLGMVKKMLVVLSAVALAISMVGVGCAFNPCMGGMAVSGDMIMIPMKVKSSYTRVTTGYCRW